MELIFLGFWLFLCVLVGMFAHRRGRFAFGWGLISLVLSPLVGWLIVLTLPNAIKPVLSGKVITDATHMRCWSCRELIQRNTRLCPHCGQVIQA
ncbi:hypothetical protein [Polaromonas sp. CG9_12]|nr:hypothetical protein [Polaromonas sp. CG9_12]